MKMYIWESATHVTDSYHNGGGFAVVAESLERARAQLPAESSAQTDAPDHVYALAVDGLEAVIRFPDAGCC